MPGVNVGSNTFTICRNKPNIGFHHLPRKPSQVNGIGDGVAVGTNGGEKELNMFGEWQIENDKII